MDENNFPRRKAIGLVSAFIDDVTRLRPSSSAISSSILSSSTISTAVAVPTAATAGVFGDDASGDGVFEDQWDSSSDGWGSEGESPMKIQRIDSADPSVRWRLVSTGSIAVAGLLFLELVSG